LAPAGLCPVEVLAAVVRPLPGGPADLTVKRRAGWRVPPSPFLGPAVVAGVRLVPGLRDWPPIAGVCLAAGIPVSVDLQDPAVSLPGQPCGPRRFLALLDRWWPPPRILLRLRLRGCPAADLPDDLSEVGRGVPAP